MSYGPAQAPPVILPFLTTWGPWAQGGDHINGVPGQDGNGVNWQSANRAIYLPVYPPENFLVVKMFVINGIGVAGNTDVGIYDDAGTRIVSSGSTAQAGTSVIQEFDITDTLLVGGRKYYFALANSSNGRFICYDHGDPSFIKLMGTYQQASALPLPSSATFATSTGDIVPLIGASKRTLVA